MSTFRPGRQALSSIGLLALLGIACVATKASAWVQRFEDAPIFTSNGDIAVDTEGDVFAGLSSDIVKIDGGVGAEIWRHELDQQEIVGMTQINAVAVDSSGDVFGGGEVEIGVLKLDGESGTELWRQGDTGGMRMRDVAVDAAGDVVAGGSVIASHSDFAVAKLDGATGEELWRLVIDSGGTFEGDSAAAVAIDGEGDVIAVGSIEHVDPNHEIFVAKVDGETGAELWRYTFEEETDGQSAIDVAIDANGDVAVVGYFVTLPFYVVLKLDGGSGAELWARTLDGSGFGSRASSVAIDGEGDVLAANLSQHRFTVVKLEGSSGSDVWQYEIEDHNGTPSGKTDLIVTETGDVYACGDLRIGGTLDTVVIVRLDGSTGVGAWRQQLDGTGGLQDAAFSLGLHPSGDVLAIANIVGTGKNPVLFTAMRLDQDDGAMAGLPGRALTVTDPGDPAKRLINVQVKHELLQSPPPGSPDDPRAAGATIRVVNPTTLEEATFTLPGGPDWKGVGNPAGSQGYQYRDKSGNGPCTTLTVRPNSKLQLSCKAKFGSIPFTLDESSQGSLAASVQFGGTAPQCAVFGGLLLQDLPGSFRAKNAPPALFCP